MVGALGHQRFDLDLDHLLRSLGLSLQLLGVCLLGLLLGRDSCPEIGEILGALLFLLGLSLGHFLPLLVLARTLGIYGLVVDLGSFFTFFLCLQNIARKLESICLHRSQRLPFLRDSAGPGPAATAVAPLSDYQGL